MVVGEVGRTVWVVVVGAAEVVVGIIVVVVLLVDVVVAVGPDTVGLAANHTPANPCPVVSPATLSPI